MAVRNLLMRDVLLVWRNPAHITNTVLFFLLILILFPFGIGHGSNQLHAVAPGVVWVTAILAILLSLDNMFTDDAETGFLDAIILSPSPLVYLVYAKLLAHWFSTALPIMLLAPVLGLLYSLSSSGLVALLITLLLGMPSLIAIGAIGAALTVSIKNSGVLLALIILPLYIPIIVFSASAVTAASNGLGYTAQVYFLAAFLLLSLSLAPFAISAALRLTRQ